MTARGIDFLENWIAKHVTPVEDPKLAGTLASQLTVDANAAGLTLDDLEQTADGLAGVIRDAIVYFEQSGTPGD